MALGEAAGTAAALAADSRRNVREIPVDSLQERLLRHGAVLVYLRDLRPGDPDYAAVQRLALPCVVFVNKLDRAGSDFAGGLRGAFPICLRTARCSS